MDSEMSVAAQALAAGDPLSALNYVALRDDAPALALRGIAMAQLGDLDRAKSLLRKAVRAFGSKQSVSRARCIVAQAEIALASRDLHWPAKKLVTARKLLEVHGDKINAAHALYVEAKRFLLLGRIEEAERTLNNISPAALPPASKATHELIVAGIAIRQLHVKAAHIALARARRAANQAGIPSLATEVENAHRVLGMPAARLISSTEKRLIRLDEVEALISSKAFIVDACRLVVHDQYSEVRLSKRPVLFSLVQALGEAWPGDVLRDTLIARLFRLKVTDASHRARLRVEVGRLRNALHALADVNATRHGFMLVPRHARKVVVLAHPVEEKHAVVLALLSDGQLWSSSALALALGTSQRTAQRALDSLAATGKVESYGQGRARRWISTPVPGITTTLLLPVPLSID